MGPSLVLSVVGVRVEAAFAVCFFLWGSRCYGRFGANLTADLELGVVRAMGKVPVAPPWVAPRRVPPNARATDPLRPDKGHVH